MKLYIKVSNDKYELPIAVADSPAELAAALGVKRESILSMLTRQVGGYHRVEIEPDVYPDNDGGLWYYDNDGRVVYV